MREVCPRIYLTSLTSDVNPRYRQDINEAMLRILSSGLVKHMHRLHFIRDIVSGNLLIYSICIVTMACHTTLLGNGAIALNEFQKCAALRPRLRCFLYVRSLDHSQDVYFQEFFQSLHFLRIRQESLSGPLQYSIVQNICNGKIEGVTNSFERRQI